jgi:stage V sporulation protein D (sporulation-specific penicillin-binding protein)
VLETVEPVALRRVMAEPLAALLREAMGRVVRDGTGTAANLDWIESGGKTGTAQKSRDGRTYTPGAFVASFGGLVPINDPRLVILTLLDEPRGVHHYAAQSAVPLYKSIVCDIRRSTDWLTDVPGARTAPITEPDALKLVTVPDVLYLSVSNAVQRLGAAGLTIQGAEKDGQVIQQIPAAGSRCPAEAVVTLAVAERPAVSATAEPALCPDFSGLSNRQVLSLAARLRIPVSVQGIGYVVRQTVAPGQTWDEQGVTLVMQESRL